MKKVLISKAIHQAGMKILEGHAEPVVATDNSLATFKKLAADVDGIILRTNIDITEEIMNAVVNLKIISRTGVGIDNIDVDAATKRQIKVCNTPGANAVSVAEQAIALMLALAKQLKVMATALSQGNWKIRNNYDAVDLDSKTLGVVGCGQIGRLTAHKCRAVFNMRTIAYDPYVPHADGIEMYDNLEDIFKQADVVSIHVPYTKATHHLVDMKLLGLMKSSAFLINTARGPIVNEQALIEALQNQVISGAGLDVFEQEPPAKENPLFNMNNVIATPHTAALTSECVARVAIEAAQAIVDEFSGREPKHIYNRKDLGL